MHGRPVFSFFARFTACFVGGVLLGQQFFIYSWFVLPVAAGLLCLINRRRFWLIYVASLAVGLLHASQLTRKGDIPASDYMIVMLKDSPGTKRMQAVVSAYYSEDVWHATNAQVMLFSRDSLPTGDASVLVHQPRMVVNADYPNPAVFTSGITVLSSHRTWIQRLRAAVTQRLAKVLEIQNAGIGMGVFLGNKTHISNSDYDLYRRAGGAHILAVSGLHAGIIYGIIFFITRPAGNRKWARMWRSIFILLVLWLYAAVTGFSPSVLRAVGFFTILTIARWRNGPVGIPHALVLLLFIVGTFRPEELKSVGLQLSYLAVGGILMFQPVFEGWIRGWPGPFLWAGRMMTVSLSAQLLTVPLLFHYFGGISLAGVAASLILIPYAFIALVLVLALVCLGDVPLAKCMINDLFQFLTALVNGSLEWITLLPGAYVERELSVLDIIIYYFILFTGLACISKPSKMLLMILLLALIGIVARV